MYYRPWRRQIGSPVPPPPAGSLPIGDAIITASEAPYRVIFTDTSYNHSGYEGVLLNDMQTVLVSAEVSYEIGASLAKYVAVMGVADLGDFSTAQYATCDFASSEPTWSGPGNYPANIGYIFTSGFLSATEVQPIEYSASTGTTPFSGEYFNGPGEIVAWSSNVDLTTAPPPAILTLQQGTKGTVLSDANLAIYGYGTTDVSIGINFSGNFPQGALGSGLIVAGYATNYFVAGVFLFLNTTDEVAVFTRVSDYSGWIESDTGISPIIYP